MKSFRGSNMGLYICGICCPNQICLIVYLSCGYAHAWWDSVLRIWELGTKMLATRKVLGYKIYQLMVF
jgi:hypothetical protein